MTALRRIQAAFQDYLLTGSPGIVARVSGNARIGQVDLLKVYRHGYQTRLIEALAHDFPGLYGLLGAEAFSQLSRAHATANPSRHPSLRWFGRGLPAYLTRHPLREHPLAAGMARFDWAVAQAFDARDQAVVAMADMLALPAAAWGSFQLTFTDAVSDFVADAAIGELRGGIMRDAAGPPIAAGTDQRWIVWRQDEDVQYRTLAVDEAAAFDLMQAGGNFGAMCQLLSDQYGNPDAALRSAQILKEWLDRGLVAVIEHDAAVSD